MAHQSSVRPDWPITDFVVAEAHAKHVADLEKQVLYMVRQTERWPRQVASNGWLVNARVSSLGWVETFCPFGKDHSIDLKTGFQPGRGAASTSPHRRTWPASTPPASAITGAGG